MIYIRKLDEDHYICKGIVKGAHAFPDKRLSIGAKIFWNKYDLISCSDAYAAFENGKVIAFLRFNRISDDPTIYAAGTYVNKEYRCNGIAKKLWTRLAKLAQRNNKPIEVLIGSRGGQALIKSIKKTNTKVKFSIDYI